MIAVLDAGPLIAAWNNSDEHQVWVQGIFKKYRGPYHITELVLAEVAHMTGRDELIAQMVREGKFLIGASLLDNAVHQRDLPGGSTKAETANPRGEADEFGE